MYWQRVLQQIGLKPQPKARVIDAGCGPAGIFILLQDKQNVTALDPLLEHYENDLAIFSRKAYPRVDFHVAPIEQSTLSGPFEFIYCFNAINHVADWSLALDRLTNWAEPNTQLILSSDVHRHNWLLPIFRLLPGDMLHPQQHSSKDYHLALTSRGWKIEQEQVLKQDWIFNYTVWVCSRQPES